MHMSTSILGWDKFFKAKQMLMFDALLVASALSVLFLTRPGTPKH